MVRARACLVGGKLRCALQRMRAPAGQHSEAGPVRYAVPQEQGAVERYGALARPLHLVPQGRMRASGMELTHACNAQALHPRYRCPPPLPRPRRVSRSGDTALQAHPGLKQVF